MTNQHDDHSDPTIELDNTGEPNGARPNSAAAPSRIPKQIGKYRIKQLIGSGGMGSVYQALQEQPRRTVAVKLMKAGIASSSALRRFEYESQLLARLSHPGIAEVHDAGTHETADGGVPYFVMEYIARARRITDYVREKGLSTTQRLELFLEACAAVHYGHTKGVIHRDLKPDNILVDSHGRVKIIDFGVARATDSDMAAATLQTDIGQLVGTVQYMSPEQVEADPNDLDTRSDVYALGVVLYELLCEQLPYDVTNVKLFDATRVIREQEAKRLSTIDRALRGDVETIVLKALEKDRDRRYQSASELADDIQRYLRDEPINARPPSLSYQVRVFARRHKGLMMAVAAVFAALLLGLAGMSWLYVDTVRARDAKADALRVAEQKTAEAEAATSLAQQKQIEAEALAQEISIQKGVISQNLYYAEMSMAHQASLGTDGLGRVRELTDNWWPDAGASADPRGWEWYYLRSLLNQDLRTFENVNPALWTDDGIRLGFRDREAGSYTLKDDTGKVVGALPAGIVPSGRHSLSPDAMRLATSRPDGKVQIWDLQTGRIRFELPGHNTPIDAFGWSPDSVWLATAAQDDGTKIWNTDTGEVKVFGESAKETHHWDSDGKVTKLVWAPDNRRLALTYAYHNRLWIIDTDTGVNYPSVETDEGKKKSGYEFEQVIYSVAWSRDGLTLAVGVGKDIVLVDPQSFEDSELLTDHSFPVLTGHRLRVMDMQWGPDGQLASGGGDRVVNIWKPGLPYPVQSFRGHERDIRVLSWNPEGNRLVSTDFGGTAKVWDLQANNQSIVPPAQEKDRLWSALVRHKSVAWAPDNRRLIFADAHHDLVVWDTQLGAEVARLTGHQSKIRCVAWSPDGRRLASCSEFSFRVWDVRNGKILSEAPTEETSSINAITWSPDGDRLVTAETGLKILKIKDMQNFELVEEESTGDGIRYHHVAWSPDGNRIAANGQGELRVWDTQLHKSTLIAETRASSITWSPDSEHLASSRLFDGGNDAEIEIWSVGTPEDEVAAAGEPAKVLRGHTNLVLNISWNATGDRIVSASTDGSAKVWAPLTGKPTVSLTHPERVPLHVAAWSPNGERLLTVDEDGVFVIWDASSAYAKERLGVLEKATAGEPTQ